MKLNFTLIVQEASFITSKKKIDDNIALEMYHNGARDGDIALRFSVKRASICKWRKSKGLEANWKYKKLNDSELIELYNRGLSDFEIGSIVGHSHCTIWHWRKRKGLESHFKRGRRVDDGFADFTPEEVDKPWKDPDSLFCDLEFLEELIGKELKT